MTPYRLPSAPLFSLPFMLIMATAQLTPATVTTATGQETPAAAQPVAAHPAANRFNDGVVSFLAKHCLECHGEKDPKADLSLFADKEPSAVTKRRVVWENVIGMITDGTMPPSDKPRPEQAEIDQLLLVVKELFDEADLHAKPDPGRVTVRRLNRSEYNNTVRDLMFDFNAAEDFPSDDIGHGFDNIGDVLTMSPVLMERYLAAAESIVQKAILVGEPPKPPKRHTAATFLQSTKKEEFRETSVRSLEANGKLSINHKLTVDGEYKFRFHGWGRQIGNEPVKIAFQIDDNEFETLEVKATGVDKDKVTYEAKPVAIAAGEHKISVAFLNEFTDPAIEKPEEAQRALFVHWLELEGPLDMVPVSHKRLLACNAELPKPEQAREILTRFASRAYRRPATVEEADRLVQLALHALDEGLSWEVSMQRAMMAALVSPKFLFRLELDDRPESPEPRALDEFQLASRMSYFLWSSMPDDELFKLAGSGELTSQIEPQVKRMLLDPKSEALVDNFAMQWLQLRRLKTVAPDPKQFPNFNEQLKTAMLKETELFFQAIIQEDRSINDLIDADFTYLNRPLAQHYGLESLLPPPPEGQRRRRRNNGNADFERVTLPNKLRGGLLTQASVLTVTSNPTRTSPVKRGRWILEQILGAPPPPPPPNVPELAEGEGAQLTGSLRQRLEQHRANPACANCHAKMDPLGFALENYNAIGGFREKDGEFPIETGGVLPGGKTFQGPAELKAILVEQQAKVGRNLIEKLMIYGLGRGLEYYDRRSVVKIQEALANNNKFTTVAIEIVKSDPFRMRRGSEPLVQD